MTGLAAQPIIAGGLAGHIVAILIALIGLAGAVYAVHSTNQARNREEQRRADGVEAEAYARAQQLSGDITKGLATEVDRLRREVAALRHDLDASRAVAFEAQQANFLLRQQVAQLRTIIREQLPNFPLPPEGG